MPQAIAANVRVWDDDGRPFRERRLLAVAASAVAFPTRLVDPRLSRNSALRVSGPIDVLVGVSRQWRPDLGKTLPSQFTLHKLHLPLLALHDAIAQLEQFRVP